MKISRRQALLGLAAMPFAPEEAFTFPPVPVMPNRSAAFGAAAPADVFTLDHLLAARDLLARMSAPPASDGYYQYVMPPEMADHARAIGASGFVFVDTSEDYP